MYSETVLDWGASSKLDENIKRTHRKQYLRVPRAETRVTGLEK